MIIHIYYNVSPEVASTKHFLADRHLNPSRPWGMYPWQRHHTVMFWDDYEECYHEFKKWYKTQPKGKDGRLTNDYRITYNEKGDDVTDTPWLRYRGEDFDCYVKSDITLAKVCKNRDSAFEIDPNDIMRSQIKIVPAYLEPRVALLTPEGVDMEAERPGSMYGKMAYKWDAWIREFVSESGVNANVLAEDNQLTGQLALQAIMSNYRITWPALYAAELITTDDLLAICYCAIGNPDLVPKTVGGGS